MTKIRNSAKWKIALPVPGLKGIRLLHDTLYKAGRPMTTQPGGYVIFRLDGEARTRCVCIATAQYAVATGRDVFLTSTKQLAKKANKHTWKKAIRDHILWMQTVQAGIETGDPETVFEYLYSFYFEDLMKVLDRHTSVANTKRIEIAVWEAMKHLADIVIDGAHFIYAPVPYLIRCIKAALSERTYY